MIRCNVHHTRSEIRIKPHTFSHSPVATVAAVGHIRRPTITSHIRLPPSNFKQALLYYILQEEELCRA